MNRAKLPIQLALVALLCTPAIACAAPGASEPVEQGQQAPSHWTRDFPLTDFTKASIPWTDISEGGPGKDGIRSIDAPRFITASQHYPIELGPNEPVISFSHGGEARAYPLRVMIRHEIVNDQVGQLPIAVTYCPLCDSAVVFDRRLDGRTLDFGTTGKLRHSDLVMYDRQTESWWQQFVGEAMVGTYTRRELQMLPSRVESVSIFRQRFPNGKILLPAVAADDFYNNPYANYDGRDRPYPFFTGDLPQDIEPMARVVAVGEKAWSLRALARRGRIEQDGLILSWSSGQNSALDARDISRGRDIGNVTVQRRTAEGLEDVPYDVTFAFAFFAFRPKGKIIDR
ncbi:MAG: DUF3179 domain-containing protein [Sphingomonas sp.]|nr:DUF3179 domain-containing protein [Sphingomonas sp.]